VKRRVNITSERAASVTWRMRVYRKVDWIKNSLGIFRVLIHLYFHLTRDGIVTAFNATKSSLYTIRPLPVSFVVSDAFMFLYKYRPDVSEISYISPRGWKISPRTLAIGGIFSQRAIARSRVVLQFWSRNKRFFKCMKWNENSPLHSICRHRRMVTRGMIYIVMTISKAKG